MVNCELKTLLVTAWRWLYEKGRNTSLLWLFKCLSMALHNKNYVRLYSFIYSADLCIYWHIEYCCNCFLFASKPFMNLSWTKYTTAMHQSVKLSQQCCWWFSYTETWLRVDWHVTVFQNKLLWDECTRNSTRTSTSTHKHTVSYQSTSQVYTQTQELINCKQLVIGKGLFCVVQGIERLQQNIPLTHWGRK